MTKTLESLELIEQYADYFVSHWMEDDGNDADDKAKCQKVSEEITAAAQRIRSEIAASRALEEALRNLVNEIRRQRLHPRWAHRSNESTKMLSARLLQASKALDQSLTARMED